jgi:hypothetical protein
MVQQCVAIDGIHIFSCCSLAHLVDYISLAELGSTSIWVSVLLVLDKQILHTYLFLKLHEN